MNVVCYEQICFEREPLKQNTVARLKSKIFPFPKFLVPLKFWAGYQGCGVGSKISDSQRRFSKISDSELSKIFDSDSLTLRE